MEKMKSIFIEKKDIVSQRMDRFQSIMKKYYSFLLLEKTRANLPENDPVDDPNSYRDRENAHIGHGYSVKQRRLISNFFIEIVQTMLIYTRFY